jgi:glycosyltransferase involved in cell wall biosynthesis
LTRVEGDLLRILYLSQYFPPEMGAPAARVYELSREWVRLGHDVTVLTGFPNHPTGVIPPEYRGELVRRESMDGIHVVRTPIYAAPNRWVVRRSLNYASYAVSAGTVGVALTGRPDVVIATSPQFLTGVAGLWLSAVKRVPFVFEVRDLWPRSIVEVGAVKAESPAIRVLERLEHELYRRSDHIVAVTESFVDEIAAHGIPRSKISVVTNGVDLELFRPRPRDAARDALGLPRDRFLATYAGTHGMAHGLDLLLDAAAQVRDEGIDFLLVGEGAEKAKLEARARAEGLRNVVFWGQMPRDRVAQVYAASDVCVAMLRDLPLFRSVIPSKAFEFMGAGRPILTTVDGESRTIIERARAGVFSQPGQVAPFVANLKRLAAHPLAREAMGRAGRAYVERHYSRSALAERYVDVLADPTGAARRQPTRAEPPVAVGRALDAARSAASGRRAALAVAGWSRTR